jgi:hypothetical protein
VDYLKEDEVFEGSIVPMYLNDKFEGYGQLVEIAGDRISFMDLKNDEDDGIVCVRQRWLIEWVNPNRLEDYKISYRKRWNQRYLKGGRTHRYIKYIAAESWEQYSYKFGGIKRKNYHDRGDSKPLNDSNILF